MSADLPWASGPVPPAFGAGLQCRPGGAAVHLRVSLGRLPSGAGSDPADHRLSVYRLRGV